MWPRPVIHNGLFRFLFLQSCGQVALLILYFMLMVFNLLTYTRLYVSYLCKVGIMDARYISICMYQYFQ